MNSTESGQTDQISEVLKKFIEATHAYSETQRRLFAKIDGYALNVRVFSKVATNHLGKNDEESAHWTLNDIDKQWELLLEDGTQLSLTDFERFKRQAGQERGECHMVFSVWPFITKGKAISDFPTPEKLDLELPVYAAALQDLPGELSKTLAKYANSTRASRRKRLEMSERAEHIVGLAENALMQLFGIKGPTLSIFHFRGGDFYSRMRQVENARLRVIDGILGLRDNEDSGDDLPEEAEALE